LRLSRHFVELWLDSSRGMRCDYGSYLKGEYLR
jgi:hypothetical protein